jgi:ATP-binding cassette subfamily F protein 3
VRRGTNLRDGYFDQHLGSLTPKLSAIEEIRAVRGDLTVEAVREYLARFRFYGDDPFRKVESLSGGERSRLALAKLLLEPRNLLFLDEPTNHLDVAAVEWLEEFLQSYASGFVIISHDRYFLDRACRRIIEIENGQATSYKGNYSDYLVEREERREMQQRAFDNQQRLIAKTEEFIRKNLAGQKTKQAKSRRTMLQKLERIDAVRADQSSGDFRLQNIERAGTHVLTVTDAAIGYGEKILARDISLILRRGECLGVIGPNGSGKTTFLKTILGKIPALSGEIRWGSKVEIGYYAQQLEDLDDRNEIIMELRRVAPSSASAGELRSFLAKFLFFGDDVYKHVRDLSGGEKGRLSLAKLIYSGVNVLVLDEPTNHLDIPSREALEEALEAYEGTIVTISHDRFFLDRVASQILALDGEGNVEQFNGDYTEYHDWKAGKSERRAVTDGQISGESVPSASADGSGRTLKSGQSKSGSGRKHNNRSASLDQSKRVKIIKKPRNTEMIEAEITQLEKRIADLSNEMTKPEIARDITKLVAVNDEYERAEAQLAVLLDEWERAESAGMPSQKKSKTR